MKDIMEVLVANGYDKTAISDFARYVVDSWNEEMEEAYVAAMEKRAIQERIRHAFDELGIPTYIKGYEHVVKAVEYAYDNPKKLEWYFSLHFFYSGVASYIGRIFIKEIKRDVKRVIRFIRRYSRKEIQKKYFGSYTKIWCMSNSKFFIELMYYFKTT